MFQKRNGSIAKQSSGMIVLSGAFLIISQILLEKEFI